MSSWVSSEVTYEMLILRWQNIQYQSKEIYFFSHKKSVCFKDTLYSITVSTGLLPSVTSLSHGDPHAVTQEIEQQQFENQSLSLKSLSLKSQSRNGLKMIFLTCPIWFCWHLETPWNEQRALLISYSQWTGVTTPALPGRVILYWREFFRTLLLRRMVHTVAASTKT